MKIIVALTLLLVLINPSIASDEAGSGIESSEPILYCVSLADEAGSGITFVEEAGSGVSSPDETENTKSCVVVN
jgi:hypothetical protein